MIKLKYVMILLVAIVEVLSLNIFNYSYAQEQIKKNISFSWSFGAIIGPKDEEKFLEIENDASLVKGNQLKMFVEIQKECFIYLFYLNPQNEVTLLFPYEIQQFETDYKALTKYYIPKGNIWIVLDGNTGTERLFLLASAHRMKNLEDIYIKYQNASTEKRFEFSKQLIEEIRRLNRQNLKLDKKAERPVPIAGRLRAVNIQNNVLLELEKSAIQISSTDFYCRTFTIEHK